MSVFYDKYGGRIKYFKRLIYKGFYQLRYFISFLLSYLFEDERCIVCTDRCYALPLCKKCLKKFLTISFMSGKNRCRICGKTLIGEHNLCIECRTAPVLLNASGVYPIFSYRLFYKNLVFEWKRQGRRNLSCIFAMLFDSAIKKLGLTDLPIVNVPPRKGKIKTKGWDQILDVCKILTHVYGYKILNLLERESSIEQKKKNRQERLSSTCKEYKPSEKLKKLYDAKAVPKEVILIDDVFTTGATAESCCQILKKYDVSKVKVIILFIVD